MASAVDLFWFLFVLIKKRISASIVNVWAPNGRRRAVLVLLSSITHLLLWKRLPFSLVLFIILYIKGMF